MLKINMKAVTFVKVVLKSLFMKFKSGSSCGSVCIDCVSLDLGDIFTLLHASGTFQVWTGHW